VPTVGFEELRLLTASQYEEKVVFYEGLYSDPLSPQAIACEEASVMKSGVVFSVLVALTVTACGDSDSSWTPNALPVVTDENVVAVGPITGFGSVIVNGVTFGTANAIVTMDDEPAIESSLRLGMIVSVGGAIDATTGEARASEISFVDDVEGPVLSMDRVAGSFVVLGRTVFVDELTVFEDAAFDDIEVGHVVKVSGLWRYEQQIQATFVRRVAFRFVAGMTMQVKGEITDLDIGQQQFRIGTQWCNYSAAMMELGGADLANGMYVQVTSTAMFQKNQMMANEVRARERNRDRNLLCDGECLYELTGYVTAFESIEDFEVDGQAVMATQDTIYVNGTADTLALDVKVSIDGTVNDAGVLVADGIVFHLPSLVEIKGNVDGLDLETETISVFGIAVLTNELTLFRDHTTSGQPIFGFGDLNEGDRVEIRAVLDGDSVIATRLERDDPNDMATLKALVEAVERPSITMLGVTVTSNQDTVFQNVAHIEIDADAFFDLVEPGSIVRSEGTYEGGSITASKMFLRECLNNCL